MTGGSGQSDLFHHGLNLRQEWDNAAAVAGIFTANGTGKTGRIAGAAGDSELTAEFNAPSVMARLEAGLDLTGGEAFLTPFRRFSDLGVLRAGLWQNGGLG